MNRGLRQSWRHDRGHVARPNAGVRGGVDQAGFGHLARDGAYAIISVTQERFIHPLLGNADRGTVLRFPEKATGLF